MTATRPILALDPSSTKTGYAVMVDERQLLCAGTLTPERASDEPLVRISSMCADLFDLTEEYRPRAVVLEMPSGKRARRLGNAGAGLSTYGVACGAIWQSCKWINALNPYTTGAEAKNYEVWTVDENTWTRSCPKAQRQRAVAMLFDSYGRAVRRDRGGDCSDAIGIGLWWFARERLLGGLKQCQ